MDFLKGDFDIKHSWDKKSSEAKDRKSTDARDRKNRSRGSQLIDAAKQIISQESLPPKQKDLNSLLIERLSKLEKLCHAQRQEIKENMQKIEKQNHQLEWFRANAKTDMKGFTENQKLKGDLLKQQAKLDKATKFLKDYGLRWQEDELKGEFDIARLKKDLQKPLFNTPKTIDINSLVRRIDQLNFNMQKDGAMTQVYNQNGINKMRPIEPLALGLYSDGLIFESYNFYKYNSKEGARILADIMDGYFPYILKKNHPNGILLKVVDRLDKAYGASEPGKLQGLAAI